MTIQALETLKDLQKISISCSVFNRPILKGKKAKSTMIKFGVTARRNVGISVLKLHEQTPDIV